MTGVLERRRGGTGGSGSLGGMDGLGMDGLEGMCEGVMSGVIHLCVSQPMLKGKLF